MIDLIILTARDKKDLKQIVVHFQYFSFVEPCPHLPHPGLRQREIVHDEQQTVMSTSIYMYMVDRSDIKPTSFLCS